MKWPRAREKSIAEHLGMYKHARNILIGMMKKVLGHCYIIYIKLRTFRIKFSPKTTQITPPHLIFYFSSSGHWSAKCLCLRKSYLR